MDAKQKRELLRNRISSGTVVRAVGAYDGITARLIEAAGFEAVWAGSLNICSALGLPDAGIVSMRDLLEVTRVLDRSTRLPIIADCDNGFGSRNNVVHLVQEYERSGIAAVCIEDQMSPKVNSMYPTAHQLESVADFSEKIRAASDARRNDDFLLIARVEALVAGRTLDEALDRADAYVTAGADIIAIQSVSDSEKPILEYVRLWNERAPLMVIPTTYRLTTSQARTLGIAIVVWANQLLRTGIRSFQSSLKLLSQYGDDLAIEPQMAELSEVFELQRIRDWHGLA